jgi:hypothetical protein
LSIRISSAAAAAVGMMVVVAPVSMKNFWRNFLLDRHRGMASRD